MNTTTRLVLCFAIGVSYFSVRDRLDTVIPQPPKTGLAAVASKMTAAERKAVADFYETLGRSIAADPDVEPVFDTKGDIRKAHRAGMLMLWRGALGNDAGKYPALREELESFMADEIGLDDAKLTDQTKSEIAKSFSKLGKVFIE